MAIQHYFIIVILVGVVWLFVEPQLYRVKRISLSSDKIHQKIKIIFISDIHFGKYYIHNRLKKIVGSINRCNADCVLIGGDYLDSTKYSKFNEEILKSIFFELKDLKSKFGTMTVLGNHDYYLGRNLAVLLELFKESSITVLRNDTLELVMGQDQIRIHGVEDLKMGKIEVEKLNIYKKDLNILISHNPDFFETCKLDFDIGFSGHTHGGQINLFGLYAPITESAYGQKYTRRLNRKNNATIITTKGLGCSMIPIRFFAMPEIVELEILPVNKK